MIKIYQTIVDKGIGNCMQAAIASLLELPLEEVPNFKSLNEEWFHEFYKLLVKHGYDYDGCLYNYNIKKIKKDCGFTDKKIKNRFHEIKKMEGVNGYFYASVFSPKYYQREDKYPVQHAVIIDKNLNIVHDVNPEYNEIKKYPEANTIKYNGIIDIFMINPISK